MRAGRSIGGPALHGPNRTWAVACTQAAAHMHKSKNAFSLLGAAAAELLRGRSCRTGCLADLSAALPLPRSVWERLIRNRATIQPMHMLIWSPRVRAACPPEKQLGHVTRPRGRRRPWDRHAPGTTTAPRSPLPMASTQRMGTPPPMGSPKLMRSPQHMRSPPSPWNGSRR